MRNLNIQHADFHGEWNYTSVQEWPAIGRLRDPIAASDATARPRPKTDASDATTGPEPATMQDMARTCRCCGGRMRIIETFARGAHPRSFTAEPTGIDSS
jgi:hypothetical protein